MRLKSIKTRLIISYLLIIVLVVTFFELFFIISVRQYYHVNIKNTLSQQAQKAVSEYSNQTYGSYDIDKDFKKIISLFGLDSNALIELYDKNGDFIDDNSSSSRKETVVYSDVKDALNGKTGYWTGRLPIPTEFKDNSNNLAQPAMSVSMPLKSQGNIVGIVRFITSLSYVEEIINRITIILILVGVGIVIMAFIISLLLSKSIVNPVKELTVSAQRFASGDFSMSVPKKYDDEIGQLSDTFNFMTEKIKENEKIKNEFVATISHDLRTPLTSIKGWAITLLNGELDNKEELIEGLNIISSESERLDTMVQELLDFSKFKAGKITLNKTFINLNSLCENIVKQLTPRAKRQGTELSIKLCPELANINVDEYRIKQVILNILDNSLKFTPQGGNIFINLKCSTNMAIINITDTGCGISDDDIPNITKKFYKSKNSTGSGLGLAIASEIITLHQGELIINSAEGCGTNIDIKLPL